MIDICSVLREWHASGRAPRRAPDCRASIQFVQENKKKTPAAGHQLVWASLSAFFGGGGFLVLLQLFSALILRLFSAYSPLDSCRAWRAAEPRRRIAKVSEAGLRWRLATEVSERPNLSIPV